MLFADFGPISQQQQQVQGGGAHSRSASGSSLDELDLSTGSLHVGTANAFVPGPSTERFERQMQRLQQRTLNMDDDEDWDIISKKIDSHVRLDTHFFEYPTDQHTSPPTSGNVDDDELTGTKVFLGGMRFEVVQVGRHMVSWLLEVACGVRIPVGRILIHRKSRNGKPAAPTGCASVYVQEDEDVVKLIGMNQKIFCGERGLHVAATPERMAQLIQSKSILDIVDGRVRGPTHPMIIERSYSSTSTHSPVTLVTTPQNGSFATNPLTGSFSKAPAPLVISDGSAAPVYHKYDGEVKVQPQVEVPPLQQPLELFVGGLCYEATRAFVSWLFSLIGITLHAQNVTLYVDPATGVKRGCAQVKIEEVDFAKASSFTRRMLCDACGVYIADTPQGIVAVQQSKERSEHGARGPTHAVVIEKRRNTQRTQAPMSTQPHAPMGVSMLHHHHQHHHQHQQQFHVVSHHQPHMGPAPPPPPSGPAPPPPPAMQVVQVGGNHYYLVPNAQGTHTYVPTAGPPPQLAPQWMQPAQGPHMPAMAPMMAPPGGMFTIPSYRGGMR